MAGHLRRRGTNSWQLIVNLGRDERGCRRSATRTVHGTKREAERALAELVTEITKPALIPTTSPRVEQVVRGWLEAKAPRLSPSSGDFRSVVIFCSRT